MQTSIIKPGLLVSLSVRTTGNVNYTRTEIEREHVTEDGEQRARWETTKVVADAKEHEAAAIVRSKARSLVAGVCCHSAFGLLCPSEKAEELDRAIGTARALADAFNATAKLTRIGVYVLAGRIAQDDAEAAREIAREVRGLIQDMERATRAGDVEAIREAANKARSMGGMLSEDVAERVNDAIAEARRIAREITRRVEKDGQSAAEVVRGIRLYALDSSRFAFLDVDQGQAVTVEAQPRAVDIDPETPVQLAPIAAAAQPRLEF